MTSLLARFKPGQRVGVFASFALGLVVTSLVIAVITRATTPPPDMLVLTPKLKHYQAHADTYDTVFLGTSRTLYHIVPADIEHVASQSGCRDMTVFNFGVFGLTGAEQDWLLDRILENPPENLKRVVIEDPLPEARSPGAFTNERGRFFHGPEHYKANLESIWSFPESLPKRAFRTGMLGAAAVYDLSNVGRASDAFFSSHTTREDYTFLFEEGGFEALDDVTSDDIVARRKDFIDNPDKFNHQLGLFQKASSPNLDARADYMIAKAEKIRAAGIEPMIFVSPDVMEIDRTPEVARVIRSKAPDLKILDFNRPDLFPELFTREIWEDFSHYGRHGAQMLSREIGAHLCDASIS